MFWLDATNSATIEQGYTTIGATILGPEDGRVASDAARALLASLTEEWLLLVDGADDANAMSGFWPPGQSGDILYTSRNPVLKDLRPDAVCEVSGLEDHAAVELLLDAARLKPASREDTRLASAIVSDLGNLALAVDQAGAYIARGECRIQNFRDTFAHHRASLLSVDAYSRATADKRAVYTTWELSYSAIQRKANGAPWRDLQAEVARNAIQLLNMLSYFHYENITEDIFKRAAENPDRGLSYPMDVDPHRLLAGDEDLPHSLLALDSSKQWDALPLRKCVSLLHSYSLLWIDHSSGTMSMHRLVHQWAFDRQPPDSRHESLRSGAATLAGSVRTSGSKEDYAISRDLLPHVVALFRQAAIDNADPLRNAYQMKPVSTVLNDNGRWSEAAAIRRRTVDINKRFLGSENEETLQSMTSLAATLREQGQYAEAELWARVAFNIQKKVLGAEDPDKLYTMEVLASAIALQGQAAEAEVLLRQVLGIKKRVLGPEHRKTLNTMQGLAVVLESLDRAAEAEALNRQVHDVRRKVLGPEHPVTLSILGNLAGVISQQKRYAEAEALSRQAYESMRKVWGPEHPETLRAMGGLALAVAYQERPVEAEALMREGYETLRKVLGPEHPATLRSMEHLAWVIRKEVKAAVADELCRAASDIRNRLLGPADCRNHQWLSSFSVCLVYIVLFVFLVSLSLWNYD